LIPSQFKTERKSKLSVLQNNCQSMNIFTYPQTLSGFSLSGCKHTTLFLFPVNLFEKILILFEHPKIKSGQQKYNLIFNSGKIKSQNFKELPLTKFPW